MLLDLGGRLRCERERLGLNLGDMGAVGGVNRNSQSEYELGRRPCTVAYLRALKSAGVDVDYVFTGSRSIDHLTREQTALLDCFDTLDPEQREAILRMVEVMSGRRRPSGTVHAPEEKFHHGPG